MVVDSSLIIEQMCSMFTVCGELIFRIICILSPLLLLIELT